MDYYVSLLGNDSNSGLSEKQPWRSIERVNATQLLPGDSVWFKADQTFFGNLCLTKVIVKPKNRETLSPPLVGEVSNLADAECLINYIVQYLGAISLSDLRF